MRRVLSVLSLLIVISGLPACTSLLNNTPDPVGFYSDSKKTDAHPQLQLSSMRHWDAMARDVVDRLDKWSDVDQGDSYPDQLGGGTTTLTRHRCLEFVHDPKFEPSKFETVFDAALIRELLLKGYRVRNGGHSNDNWCSKLSIQTTVARPHAITGDEYFSGKYTALAEGLIVTRNVARAISEVNIVAGIGLGELAYRFSPSYLASHQVGEVALAISVVDGFTNAYRAQYTNVYYVDYLDTALYTPKAVKPDPNSSSNQTGTNTASVNPQDAQKPGTWNVVQTQIQCSSTTAQFVVMGSSITGDPANYTLDGFGSATSVVSSSITWKAGDPAPVNSFTVNFEKIKIEACPSSISLNLNNGGAWVKQEIQISASCPAEPSAKSKKPAAACVATANKAPRK